jgi:hypothetical protein
MMKLLAYVGGIGALVFAAASCSTGPTDGSSQGSDESLDNTTSSRAACSGGRFHCYAMVQTDGRGLIKQTAAPSGLGATDLADAYKLNTATDPHATVAIVDAYGYPNAAADLATYRSQYGLPPCTVANGCLTIVNQRGETSPLPPAPPSGDDWTTETALDLDMASAACPKCKLLLIQADDDQGTGLFVAQATAARMGAAVVSDSWGTSETPSDPATSYEHFFAQTNIGIFVAAGDSGYDNGGQGPDYPSTSAYVTAVGGTNLAKQAGGRGWVEKAWGQSFMGGAGGSSCGLTVPKPAWQGNTACSFRAASDVAAVGDPATGPAVYNQASGGWIAVGGTSAASPLVAAIYALTGHGNAAPNFAYTHTGAYFDVTSGSNGTCGNVLCNAGAGWDGPTGIGTPNGAALATAACTPSCAGKTCGNDGCGGSCGACNGTDYCSATGSCIPACQPSCTGKTCGNDGCGGSCGNCPTGQACGTNNQCGACTPSCQSGTCGGQDGCGGTCQCPNGGFCFQGMCL